VTFITQWRFARIGLNMLGISIAGPGGLSVGQNYSILGAGIRCFCDGNQFDFSFSGLEHVPGFKDDRVSR
jgi:hypothetical protein